MNLYNQTARIAHGFRFGILSIGVLLLLTNCTVAQTIQTSKLPPATISRSEVMYLYSKSVQDTFKISISYPVGYSPDDTITYPVIYVTDANTSFGILSEMTYVMQLGNELPNMIIVGIGYKTDTEWLIKRNRDLTPVYDSLVSANSGGAANFLKFIKTELKPIIKKKYKVSSNETYVGFSYGGLFGLYVMLNESSTFTNYLIGSPSIWVGNGITYQYFDNFKKTHTNFNSRVYMSVGSLEQAYFMEDFHMINNWQILSTKFINLRFVDFSFKSHEFPNQTHLSGSAVAFDNGLRFIYEPFLQP